MFKAILQTALAAFSPRTLNLASQAGLKVSRVSPFHARVRLVPSFFFFVCFQRRSTATSAPTSKQRRLNLPGEKLIADVVTRWKGSLDVLECYLEAVAAALLTAKVRQNARETDTFDTADSADAKDKTLHTFEKCHHCAVSPCYAAPQTHDAREHDTM